MKRNALIYLCILPLIWLCGCTVGSAGKIFRYDIPAGVENLDPQFATDPTAVMIISNIYEGLLVNGPDGELLPGVAISYDISADGLVYRFLLREGAEWSDGETPVTASDFVFTFQRIFDSQSPSPYARRFLTINGAEESLAGTAPASGIGVYAEDDHTLVVTLSRPDPLFLENISTSAAMPCNRDFFLNCRGRYGLDIKLVCGNGPFSLSKWDNERSIILVRASGYASENTVIASGVNLYIGNENTVERFGDGKTDAITVPASEYTLTQKEPEPQSASGAITWCIVFNHKDTVWSNPLLRQALARIVDRRTPATKDVFTLTELLLPPAMRISAEPFPSQVSPVKLDTAQAIELFKMGLDTLELDKSPSCTIYVPENGEHALYMGNIQQDWQKELSFYSNIRTVPYEQIDSRLKSGDFQIMLVPFTAHDARADDFLDRFSSGSPYNYTGYRSQVYDRLLELAREQDSFDGMSAIYAQAQTMLLSDAAVIPLYNETTYCLAGDNVKGLWLSPFGGAYFKYADKT